MDRSDSRTQIHADMVALANRCAQMASDGSPHEANAIASANTLTAIASVFCSVDRMEEMMRAQLEALKSIEALLHAN